MLVDHKRKWFPFFTICLELNDKRERRKQTNSLGGLLVACVTNKVTPVEIGLLVLALQNVTFSLTWLKLNFFNRILPYSILNSSVAVTNKTFESN